MAGEDLKARILADFDPDTLHDTLVEEWDQRIYYKPMTLRERSKVNFWKSQSGTPEGLAVFARTVILKALDENGKPIFGDADLEYLMTRANPDVVMKLSTTLITAPREEDLKNS